MTTTVWAIAHLARRSCYLASLEVYQEEIHQQHHGTRVPRERQRLTFTTYTTYTMWHSFPIALLLPGFIASVKGQGVTDKSLTVETTSGTYTGLVNPSVPDVNQWLGIPYGRPPVGSLRFMPPEESANHGTGLSATSYKPICMQNNGNRTGVFWDIVPEFQNTDQQSEDCLYLNIWGPRKPVVAEKLPVIVWVCGGAFNEGGGHAPYQVPDHWIQRTQTHLVVAFKYAFPNSHQLPEHDFVENLLF